MVWIVKSRSKFVEINMVWVSNCNTRSCKIAHTLVYPLHEKENSSHLHVYAEETHEQPYGMRHTPILIGGHTCACILWKA